MSRSQGHLFATTRLQMTDAIELTLQSLQAYGPSHPHWAVAWSGGKDSTATLTVLCWLLDSGRLARPKSLTVYYADTRLELPPLAIAAQQIMQDLEERGIPVRVVMAPLDKRFLVYMLGRGVPPPNNKTLRWCTGQIKVRPMEDAIAERLQEVEGLLMLTGVRQGESAMRDGRIAMSCGKDGAECGQGWFQEALPHAKGVRGRISTLAPLLHWRVCHVWEWLKHWASHPDFGDWHTTSIADAYGGDEAEEINARTGCTGCPLVSQETALNTILRNPAWTHLQPLKGLHRLWRELRLPRNRLRKAEPSILKGGTMAANPQRMGPLTLAARLMALDRVLDMQGEVNAAADRFERPRIDLINGEEEARIRVLIATGTWPQGWDGTEPAADIPLPATYNRDGTVQWVMV